MHRQKRLVVWPLACPWRLPLTTTIPAAACRTSACTAFTTRSIHSTCPLRNSSSPSVAHETDLSFKTNGPATTVLPSQQQQHKQSKDFRRRIHRSLDKLVLRDLSSLLMASGLPLTGTKPVLANRLVNHLASIMDKIDHLGPEFFLHNNGNNITNTNTNMHTSLFSDNNSAPPPHSSFFSSTATTDTTTDITATPPTATATRLKSPGRNHNRQDSNQINPEVLARIKDKALPRSIVSIDIGIRNLAWVELSKDGEILRWAVEDLLVPSSTSFEDSQVDLHLEDKEEGRPATEGSTSKKPRRPGVAGSNTKQRVKKTLALPYDPRSVALRVEKVMRTILQESQSVGGIILERQRFRTGGMPTVLDSTFKCGVVEGMIHTWFAFWQHEQQQRRGRVMAKVRDEDGEEKEAVFIESVPPRAVAVRWGIGASGAKAATASNREKKKKQTFVLDTTATDMNENDAVSNVVEEGEGVGVLTDRISPVSTDPAPAARAPKSLSYHHKKAQSRNIVDNWIYSNQDEQLADPAIRWATTESSSLSKLRVHCSPEMREWYSREQKRDDLSDCLLQAVAWFEWRGRAVQEAVERSMPMPMLRYPVEGGVDGEGTAAVRTSGLQPLKV